MTWLLEMYSQGYIYYSERIFSFCCYYFFGEFHRLIPTLGLFFTNNVCSPFSASPKIGQVQIFFFFFFFFFFFNNYLRFYAGEASEVGELTTAEKDGRENNRATHVSALQQNQIRNGKPIRPIALTKLKAMEKHRWLARASCQKLHEHWHELLIGHFPG